MLRIFSRPLSKWKIVLLGGDACFYFLTLLVSLFLNPKTNSDPILFLSTYKLQFFLMGLVYLLVNYIADLYDFQKDYRRWWHTAQVLLGVMIGALTNIVLFYFPLGVFVGRTLLLIQAPLFATFLVLWRAAFSAVALPHRLQRKIIIVGAGSSGQRILQALHNRPLSGLLVQGFVDDDPQKVGTVIDGLPVMGDSSQLLELASQTQANLIVVAITHEKSQQLVDTLTRVSWSGLQVIDMPNFYEYLAGKVPTEHISDVWLLFNSLNKNSFYTRYLKRLMDLVLAGLLLVVTVPLLALIALAIKVSSRGPIFYYQERLGYEGRPFKLIKFRTMVRDAESNGPQWATDDDSRITRVGQLLRKFRLDELPQLFNVLMGEMSVIGPRPEREVFIREFQEMRPQFRPGRRASDPPGTMIPYGYKEKIPFYGYRLLVKPGITGWGQIMYPYASSMEQTKDKLDYDLFYVKNVGFFLDMAILLKTIRIVLFGRGT